MKCNICKKESKSGCIHHKDKTTICSDCLQYAPNFYGFMSGKELMNYIIQEKTKKWWQFWK